MDIGKKQKLEKLLLLSVKIAIGSSVAIYIAGLLHLDYTASAGTITLLSLMTTKWDTLRQVFCRLLTFLFTAAAAWIIYPHIASKWVGYGMVVLLIVLVSESLELRSTISVNAVIAAHFMTDQSIMWKDFYNELMLVLIGIVIAFFLSLLQLNHNRRKDIIANMRYTEECLKSILLMMVDYLLNRENGQDVWDKIHEIRDKLKKFRMEAKDYEQNTYRSHKYYEDYFEMRLDQCRMLDSLHYEITRMRSMPKQAKVVADYMLYLSDYVIERNVPDAQLEKLYEIFHVMEKEELPVTREEFESRAMLFHVLMDIEEFLKFKQEFVQQLDDRQLKEYWKQQPSTGFSAVCK